MNTEELLKDFIDNGNDGIHPRDRERFVRYAVSACISGLPFDEDAISTNIHDSERVGELAIAFEWIKDALKITGQIS